jgi:hypothetical protein
MYMFLGRSALLGQISLFQDELVGNRLPLPYYFIGLSQLLWPGSLVAARLLSAVLGLACIVLVLVITTRLGGELAGILATLFAVTQSLIIGYFASASYHSLVAFLLLTVVYVTFCTTLPYRRVIAMGLISILFFTRTNTLPVIPFMLFYLLWQAKNVRERLVLLALAAVPPAMFFASDMNHLKLLAYVPLLSRFVLPLGFQSNATTFSLLNAAEHHTPVVATLLLLAKWYRVWILAGLGLLVGIAVRVARRHPMGDLVANRSANFIGAITLYVALSQLIVVGSWDAQYAVGYSPSFALLAAICLGFWCALLLETAGKGTGWHSVGVLLLSALFLIASAQSKPPILPLAVSYSYPPTKALYSLAAALEKAIPKGSRIFRFGEPLGLYIAGRAPYLRQERDVATFSPFGDQKILKRSGLWGEADIREWVTRDADYAVVAPAAFDFYRNTSIGGAVQMIESLLGERFSRIAVLDQYPGRVYHVYKRIPASG